MLIYDFINKNKIKDRDKLVKKVIEDYYVSNSDAMNDGLYKNFLVIGPSINNKILELYNIDKAELKEFRKTNKTLASGYQILDDFVKLCLLTSYHDTKDREFGTFILVMYQGAKMSNYFPYRDSAAYENRMRYAVMYDLPKKAYIYQEGTMYGAMDRYSKQFFIDNASSAKHLDVLDKSDNGYLYLLGRLRTMVNATIKVLKNVFEKVDEKSVRLTQDVDAPDGESKLELASNTTFISTMGYVIQHHNQKDYDYDIMKLLKMDTHELKYTTIELLRDEERDWFHEYAKIYYDYYVENHFTNKDAFMSNFIPKCINAKLNGKGFLELDADLVKTLYNIKDKYKELYPDQDLTMLNKFRHMEGYIRQFKNYVIIKIRKLANEL